MRVVLCTGLKRSGKDTLANHLVESYGYIRYAFADPIKEALKTIFLWDEEYVNGSLKEIVDPRWGISPRKALQYTGTELFREKLPEISSGFKKETGSTIWITRFLLWYRQQPENTKIVISDARFPNELKLVKSYIPEAVSIRVERFAQNTDLHASEAQIQELPVDYILTNRGTLEDFYKKIDQLF